MNSSNTTALVWAVVVNGCVVHPNLASKALAESVVSRLPIDQQTQAQIVPMTSQGQTVLFG